MQQLTGIVEAFQTSEAKKSTKGYSDYFNHTYTVNGLKFSKFGKSPEAEVSVGSTVSIVYETKQSEREGKKLEFRNIDSINKIETSTSSNDSVIKASNGGGGAILFSPAILTKTGGSLTARDLAIIRQNAVSSAIAILAQTPNKVDITMLDVLGIAAEIVRYTSEPYLDSTIVDKLNNKS